MLIRTEEPKERAAVYAVNQSAFEVPAEAFMLVERQSGYLHGASGKVECHAAFSHA